MRKFKFDDKGVPESIPDRLVFARRNSGWTAAEVAARFNVDKSTASRWETAGFWAGIRASSGKREILLKLAELYQVDFYWLLNGREIKNAGTILLVDDDNTSLTILAMMIKKAFGGLFREQLFKTASQALTWARHNPAAAVLIDYKLPGMNGDKLIKKLRDLPHYRSVPIYAVTLYDGDDVERSLRSAGADEVILKPVSDNVIFKLLNTISMP